MHGFPPPKEWLGFLAAVFVASVLINIVTSRVPQLAQLQRGI